MIAIASARVRRFPIDKERTIMDLSQVRKVGDAVVLEFPDSRSDEARRAFHDLLKALASNAEYKKLIIDLGKVSWFSSLDLGGLVFAYKEMTERNDTFCVAGAGPRIQGIFTATKMDTVFPMYDSVDAALAE